MAEITATVTRLNSEQGVHTVVWETLTDGDTGIGVASGEEISLAASADRSVQVEGTFNSRTVTIEGSNDGTNWHTLTDQTGADLSFTAAGLGMVAELTRYIRPSVSGSGSGADIDVTLLVRKTQLG